MKIQAERMKYCLFYREDQGLEQRGYCLRTSLGHWNWQSCHPRSGSGSKSFLVLTTLLVHTSFQHWAMFLRLQITLPTAVHYPFLCTNTQICIIFAGARVPERLAKDQCQPWGRRIYQDHLWRYTLLEQLPYKYALAAILAHDCSRSSCNRLCDWCKLQRAGGKARCWRFPGRWCFFEGNEKSRKTADVLFPCEPKMEQNDSVWPYQQP